MLFHLKGVALMETDDIIDFFDIDEELDNAVESMCDPVTSNIKDWG